MQILAQPPPFTIRYSRDLLIEAASLSHLTLKRGRAFIDTLIEFTNEPS
jgi:hypothetical protein